MTNKQYVGNGSRTAQKSSTDADGSTLELSTSEFLLEHYGPLLNAKALVDVLHYSGQVALERSIQRGHLSLKTFHLPGRRGVFAYSTEVAKFIAQQITETSTSKKTDSQSGSTQLSRIEKGA